MPPQVIRNDQTGEVALFDTDKQEFVGKILKHDKTGAYGLWDENAKSLKPIQMPKDFAERVDISKRLSRAETRLASDKNEMARLNGQVSTGGRVEPMVLPKGKEPETEVFGAWDKATSELGRGAQRLSEPYIGGTGSDVVGALTQETARYFGPQALSTGGRLVAKAAAMLAPGSQGGKIESLIGKTRTALDAGKLSADKSRAGFEKVTERNASTKVPLPNTLKTIDEIGNESRSTGLASPSDIQEVASAIRSQAGAPTLGVVDKQLTAVGKKTKAVLGQDADPAYKRVFAAMVDDLEKAPSGKGVVLRAKDEAVRRSLGWNDVIDEFNSMVKMKRGLSGFEDINANQLMDKLRKNEFLQKSLPKEDWEQVTPILKKLADTAAAPPPRGASFGAGRAATFGGGAMLMGLPPAIAAGMGVLDYGVGHLLMTSKGRSLVKTILDAKAYEPSQKLNILNGMGRLAVKGYEATQGDQDSK